MEKIWLRSYPEGVPAEIDINRFDSLKALLEFSCHEYGSRPAFSNMDHTLSYADLDRLSQSFGAFLQHSLGLRKGARVALMMPNLLQYPVALFGVLRAGLTVVNVNPLYTPRELQHQLKDSGAETIVILENFAHTLQDIIAQSPVKQVITTQIGDMLPAPKRLLVNLVVKHVKKMVPKWQLPATVSLRRVLAQGAGLSLQPVELGHNDVAFLQYTGGTTGVAKGATLTHGNMVANLLQVEAWIQELFGSGSETIITALPLYHIFSLTANCLVFSKAGGHNVLITNPRDMAGFVKELGKYRFTIMTGVNTLFNGLLNTPGFAQLDFSSLKSSIAGGMALQRAVSERWQQVTGTPLIEGYGLTETSPVVCANPITSLEYNGSIGLPLPSTNVSIRDENGQELDIGEAGELWVRGPQVMQGYWQRPEETANVLHADGWLSTGDVASIDEKGYVRIVDRKKDMILVSGFNVYPNEIEDVLALLPQVMEAAAIGLPDEKSGEIVKVFIVKKDPELNAETIIQHCKKHLTAYKVPRQVEFRDELPKTNVGKILRRALRDEAIQALKKD